MAEESDLVYLSVPAIKETNKHKKKPNQLYKSPLSNTPFCENLTILFFSFRKKTSKQTISLICQSDILAMTLLLIFKWKCWSCWTSNSRVQYSIIQRKISCEMKKGRGGSLWFSYPVENSNVSKSEMKFYIYSVNWMKNHDCSSAFLFLF